MTLGRCSSFTTIDLRPILRIVPSLLTFETERSWKSLFGCSFLSSGCCVSVVTLLWTELWILGVSQIRYYTMRAALWFKRKGRINTFNFFSIDIDRGQRTKFLYVLTFLLFFLCNAVCLRAINVIKCDQSRGRSVGSHHRQQRSSSASEADGQTPSPPVPLQWIICWVTGGDSHH